MIKRFDERDTIFSRMYELQKDSTDFTEYYHQHPELKEIDDKLRSHTDGVFADRVWENAFINGGFDFLKDIRTFSGATEYSNNPDNLESSAENPTILPDNDQLSISVHDLTGKLEQTARSLGAEYFGATPAAAEFAYSVRGRGKHYGKSNNLLLPNALVFAVPMDEKAVNKAPAIEETVEVVAAYIKVAVIGMALSYSLRELGFKAVCHMDGESQFVLPPLAEAAGLGRIGWMGLLLTQQHGPRVRIGAVTTNAPVAYTKKIAGNILSYCRTCGKCAEVCPSQAIRTAAGEFSRPALNHEACYGTWCELGTDCGACLAVCPYGRGNNEISADDTPEKKKPGPGDPDFLKSLLYG